MRETGDGIASYTGRATTPNLKCADERIHIHDCRSLRSSGYRLVTTM